MLYGESMQSILKFNFSILTQNGLQIDSITIQAKDFSDAERKLRQMYTRCEILKYASMDSGRKISQSADIEDLLSLIVSCQ